MKLILLAANDVLFKFSLAYLDDGDLPPAYEALLRILGNQIIKQKTLSLKTDSTDTEVIISISKIKTKSNWDKVKKLFKLNRRPWWETIKKNIERNLRVRFSKPGETNLNDLPLDLIIAVGEFLPLSDRNSFARVNKQAYPIVLQPTKLLQKHFPNEILEEDDKRALTLFKNNYAKHYASLCQCEADLFKWSKEGEQKILNSYSSGNYHLLNLVDKDRNNPLFWLAFNGHHRLLKQIFETSIKKIFTNAQGEMVRRRCPSGLTLLDWAVLAFQDDQILQNLLIAQENNPPVVPENILYWSALHYAARQGNLKAFALLYRLKPEWLTTPAAFGVLPLHVAIDFGHMKIVNYIFALGNVDWNARNDHQETLLFYAAKKGNLPLVQTIYQNMPSLLFVANTMRITPLLIAVIAKHTRVVEFLGSLYGFAINATDVNGHNALHYAVLGNDYETVKILCEYPDMDINGVSGSGFTPLMLAHKNKDARIISLLEAKFNNQTFLQKFTVIKELVNHNLAIHERVFSRDKVKVRILTPFLERHPQNEEMARDYYHEMIAALVKISKASGNNYPAHFHQVDVNVPISTLYNTALAVPSADLPAITSLRQSRCF